MLLEAGHASRCSAPLQLSSRAKGKGNPGFLDFALRSAVPQDGLRRPFDFAQGCGPSGRRQTALGMTVLWGANPRLTPWAHTNAAPAGLARIPWICRGDLGGVGVLRLALLCGEAAKQSSLRMTEQNQNPTARSFAPLRGAQDDGSRSKSNARSFAPLRGGSG